MEKGKRRVDGHQGGLLSRIFDETTGQMQSTRAANQSALGGAIGNLCKVLLDAASVLASLANSSTSSNIKLTWLSQLRAVTLTLSVPFGAFCAFG